MIKIGKLAKFSDFDDGLEQTKLPGTASSKFRREAYALVRRCIYLQSAQQDAKRLAKEQLRPIIRSYNGLIKALDKLRENCGEIKSRAEKISAEAGYWQIQFSPVEEAIKDLRWSVEKNRQNAMGQVPTPLRKKSEVVAFEPVLTRHDYPLSRLGWKPAETWLIGELDGLISKYAKTISHGKRCALIQAIFAHGSIDNKDLKAIAVALSRNKITPPKK